GGTQVLVPGQSAVAKPQGPDQPAMDHEIRIAADWRCKMGIAAQIKAEMAVVLCRIFSLRLRAQHQFVDELLGVMGLHPREDAVELAAPQHAPFGHAYTERTG